MQFFITPSRFRKEWTALRVGAVGLCLLCFILVLNSWWHSPFPSYNLHQKVMDWRIRQQYARQDFQIKRKLVKISTVISDYSALIDKEQQLSANTRSFFSEEEKIQQHLRGKDVPSTIEKHKTELDQSHKVYKQLEFNYSSQFVRLVQNYHGKQRQGRKQIIKNSQDILEQIELYLIDLEQSFERSYKWYRSQKDLENEIRFSYNQLGNYQSDLVQDYEDSDVYKAMPALAQSVLSSLPIELTESLYNDSQLAHREEIIKKRIKQVGHFKQALPPITFTAFNLASTELSQPWGPQVAKQYRRLASQYEFSSYKQELGMCVLVPTYQNNKDFRVELNLNSIFAQNYTNYKAVIIDDASTDGTPQLVDKYLNFYQLGSSKAQLIRKTTSKKALENIYYAALKNCIGFEVAVIVDGDDELIGFNVLKTLNAVYSRKQAGLVYSNFYYNSVDQGTLKKGFTSEYTHEEKMQGYRKARQKFSHLITFKINLLREVNVKDFQDEAGRFYQVAYDFAMVYPMMELACSHVQSIDEYQYLYNVGTGMNDYDVHQNQQLKIGKKILSQKPYPCSKRYKRSY